MGVIRHADAGYERAIDVAAERGVRIPHAGMASASDEPILEVHMADRIPTDPDSEPSLSPSPPLPANPLPQGPSDRRP